MKTEVLKNGSRSLTITLNYAGELASYFSIRFRFDYLLDCRTVNSTPTWNLLLPLLSNAAEDFFSAVFAYASCALQLEITTKDMERVAGTGKGDAGGAGAEDGMAMEEKKGRKEWSADFFS